MADLPFEVSHAPRGWPCGPPPPSCRTRRCSRYPCQRARARRLREEGRKARDGIGGDTQRHVKCATLRSTRYVVLPWHSAACVARKRRRTLQRELVCHRVAHDGGGEADTRRALARRVHGARRELVDVLQQLRKWEGSGGGGVARSQRRCARSCTRASYSTRRAVLSEARPESIAHAPAAPAPPLPRDAPATWRLPGRP